MTSEEKKKARNRAQYLRKKSLAERPLDIIVDPPLFGPTLPPAEAPPADKKHTALSTFFLTLLVAAITFYLLTEMVQFYVKNDGGFYSACLKAAILEGSVIALCTLRTRSFLYTALAALIYLYTVWVVSNSALLTINSAWLKKAESKVSQAEKAELEAEIFKQAEFRLSAFQTQRFSLGMRIDKSIESLRDKLQKKRESLIQDSAYPLGLNNGLNLVVFRILVMATNLVCLKELSRRWLKRLN